MLKRNSANEDELDHIRARQAVAPNFMHPRALKLQHAIDLPRRFLNMFDNAGGDGKRNSTSWPDVEPRLI
ncbi:hypothetical protein [uncultured Bradyrhizobium sp.]|uniref:hypothetical protein n=1 Tax=Bradyrhizobium sp. TaxID=376 RepID=UPI0026350B0F|nr:hypothetical protein [uncultured Bradyrhizobium sp.]